MAPSHTSPLPRQLEALCAAHPQARKYVLVPRVQLGRALEKALARRRGHWAGLTCLLPRQYAAQWARARIRESGRSELMIGGQPFLAAHLLRNHLPGGLQADLPDPRSLAPLVADTIDTLRLDGVTPVAVTERADREGAPATFRAVAACYHQYHDVLDEHGLYDDALCFRWATEQVRDESTAPVVAVADGVELPGRPAEFVGALRENGTAFYRFGTPSPDGAPPQTAAARFAEGPVPTASDEASASPTWGFRRAVGRRAEIDAVLRDILEAEVPFDDVEIALTESGPYLSRLADRAEQVGVPVTVGPGRPASDTRPGQALMAFFDWITEDFDAEVLIRMLRSGHLRLDRLQAEWDGPPLAAHEVATLLAERRYESGRGGYRRTLKAALDEVEDRIDELQEQDLSTDPEEETRRRLRRTRRIVEALLELAPRRTSVQEMAAHAQRFLETLNPVDAPPDRLSEEERSLDQAARTVLWQKLDALTGLPFDDRTSASQCAALLQRWLDGRYVRAQQPRAGTVHVLPLESAGYGGRSHLYVLGMDGDTFAAGGGDSLLRDADRQALRAETAGVDPTTTTPADEALWRALRALGRHDGTTTLYTRTFDLDSGEERYPSPLYLRLEDEHGTASGTSAGLAPPAGRVHLTDADAWLAAHRRARPEGEAAPTARAALQAHYPWITAGEEARAARQSDTYGAHDGLLTPGDDAALDLFGADRPLSASRLETLAETPYVYFLRYVLGVEPLDEPALDDEPWLTPLRRGSVLHATFERFMRDLDGSGPTRADEEALLEVLNDQIDREIAQVAPRNQVEEEGARRQLRRDARVFLRAEAEHTRDWRPEAFELGFGFGPRRRKPQDEGDATLTIGGHRLSLRGRIDRVDRGPDGALAIWDYKTGSASGYDEDDPLQDGAHLQWVLYAYALEALRNEPVERSGYFFPTTKEMGTRIAFRPAAHRAEVEALMERLRALARSGSFPMTPDARNASAWRYRGYDRLVRDLRARSRTLGEKSYPDDRPAPPFLD